MVNRCWLLAALSLIATISIPVPGSLVRADIPDKLSFNTHVRPILSDKCFACHGFDSKKRQADLRLDTLEGATALKDGAAAIVPGELEKSHLWQRINSSDQDAVMPPPSSHKALTDEEKEILRRWIVAGAAYQKHWAFEAIQPSIPPTTVSANPIDGFIQVRVASAGLKPAARAEKEILVRRAAFALTGLPPTIAQVDDYLGDSSGDAYEKMVDRFINSQQFGEEMARHWLDVARYADTHGMHLDNERQTWAYRDWVIGAFNRNLPFDQFTIEQLAGDLLPNPSYDQLTATGFNRCNVTTSEGGSINEELLYRYAVDRASTTMQAWLGLTGGCAVCHDHKFDPITQKEFYSFYAFFNSAADPAMDGNALLTQPVLKLTSAEDKEKLTALELQIAEQQKKIDAEQAQLVYQDPAEVVTSAATGEAAPQPAIETIETIWMEDEFPAEGTLQASPGAATQFVTASDEHKVYSGQKSIKRTDAGLAQDVWDNAKKPLRLPSAAKIFAYVWLDPHNTPKSIMLQFFKSGWEHRAVWGDYEAINWGAAGTPARVHMGALPATGQWIRVEVPVEKVGLAAGDELKGFALTQHGGSLYWDHVGVSGTTDPTTDPTLSFLAWWKNATGKDTAGVPGDLKDVAKGGPEKKPEEGKLARLRAYYLQEVCQTTKPKFANLLAEQKQLRSQRTKIDEAIPSTFVFNDLPKPRESFVMMRGAYDKPGEAVEPNVLSVLPPLKKADPAARATRLDLARWLVSGENPLTSRVAVNRFWQQFFGIGLVKTSYDFGSQGEMPSHPELLDWLARDFESTGWDVKRLVRLLVCSETFKQSSQLTPELYRIDPENRWLARGPRFRLDGEQIRDNALFISGLLNAEMGGKGVKPYQPDNIWEPVGFGGSNTQIYRRDNGPALYRRSIYNFIKRTAPPPFMVNFDAPNREQFCTMREKSNTPLQALQLMNDVQHIEAARATAQRLIQAGGSTAEQRIAYGYRLILARGVAEREMSVLLKQLDKAMQHYRSDTELAKKLIAQGDSKADASLDPTELAAYTMIANTLLNLDETVSRN